MWTEALQLFDVMLSRMVEADVIAFNALISACGKACEWDRALQLFNVAATSMAEPNIITFSATISNCEEDERWAFGLGARAVFVFV